MSVTASVSSGMRERSCMLEIILLRALVGTRPAAGMAAGRSLAFGFGAERRIVERAERRREASWFSLLLP
jgi:hypothetical protein